MQSTELGAAQQPTPDRMLRIVRTFDAPRALVWRLWTDPEHRLRWWGPEEMALSHLEMDFREGGRWRMVMRHVGGYEHPVFGTFHEIREPSRLSFTYINESDGHETLVTLDFIERDGRTEMRFEQATFPSVEQRDGHNLGWQSTLVLLDDYVRRLAGDDRPLGPPRIDGVAEDLRAARERLEQEQANGNGTRLAPGGGR